ncbi:hypothetical protein CANCADRAFT_15629, partial [Tortispora caseinolytica NRRL Y-17796]
DRQESVSRINNLQQLRSNYLIGESKPLTDWGEYLVDIDMVRRPTQLIQFYLNQNDLIQRFITIDNLLDSTKIHRNMIEDYEHDARRRQSIVPANAHHQMLPILHANEATTSIVNLAIYVNLALNAVLLAAKVVVALMTNSLSVIAALVDSFLDLMSTVIIWASAQFVAYRGSNTKYVFPVGKSRLEPIGVLVFSILIIMAFIQVAAQSISKLYAGVLAPSPPHPVQLTWSSFIIMISTIIAKIMAYVWCRNIGSSAVQALAQDAMTDMIFNTCSIIFPVLGFITNTWWLDPLGAVWLSLYVIVNWGQTALDHISNLTGAAADQSDRQLILYLCMRFSSTIRKVTSLNAYHSGDKIIVEVDLVVDDTLSLRDSHDLGETLQYAIETLPFVERAFVHLDYRYDNYTGHL